MSGVNKDLLEALKWAVREYEKNACAHEDTRRLGFCWTECSVCGKRWADDEGGFVPYKPPAELDAAHAAISRAEAELANEAKADDDGWIKWYGGSLPKLFVRLRSGDVMSGAIDEFSWERDGDLGDILSFKLEPKS